MLLEDAKYQGQLNKNPFDFKAKFPVRGLRSAGEQSQRFDLLLSTSGKNRHDAYLLDPDTFEEGYFIVPFDLTAVQDEGDSVIPQFQMLINIRRAFLPRQV